jgi:hypothetical protein
MAQSNLFKAEQGIEMKAIVCTKYGTPDVLQIEEAEKRSLKTLKFSYLETISTVHIFRTLF